MDMSCGASKRSIGQGSDLIMLCMYCRIKRSEVFNAGYRFTYIQIQYATQQYFYSPYI